MNKDLSSHFLYASTIFSAREEFVIQTVLGSCISVCFWDKQSGIGGMNHYMLPYWDGQGLNSPKYGNIAIPKLYDKMISYGCKKQNIVAKVFGGAEVLKLQHNHYTIGKRNIEIAWEILNEMKIPIVSHHVGGKLGRKIYFNTNTGVVHLKVLEPVTCEIS